MKKQFFIVFIILFSLFLNGFSQEGYVFITNYKTDKSFTDSKVYAVEFNNISNLFLANRTGIAIFDGVTWNMVINGPMNSFALEADSTKQKIYVGAKDCFGYISAEKNGTYRYFPIQNFKYNLGDFTKILTTDDKIVFYSEKNIFIISKNNEKDNFQLKSEDHGLFSGIFTRKNNLYVNINGIGICKLENKDLKPLKNGQKFKDSRIHFSVYGNAKNIILGTDQNKIYIFDGQKFLQFSGFSEIRKFLEENILWDGIDISVEYFAVTTLTGGCVIINKEFGKIEQTINYQTGLPDDEIFSISKDNENGIWLTHEHGFSRFDPNIQIRNYSSYPGIYGNINDVLQKKDQLYVATNEGVYNFRPVKNFAEIEKLVYQRKSIKKKTSKRRRSKRTKNVTVFEKVKVKEYVVQSIKNKFAPIEDFNYECKQLYEIDTVLFAVSDYGIFQVKNSAAYSILEDVYVNDICRDADTFALYVASLKGVSLITLNQNIDNNKETWVNETLFEEFSEPVYSIIQDDFANLFFGAEGKAYICMRDSILSYSEPIELNFPERFYEPVYVKKINDEICFIQSKGIYFYDDNSKSIKLKTSDSGSDTYHYILGKDNAWVLDNKNWTPLDTSGKYLNKEYLNLFDGLGNICPDYLDNIWLINDSKELIKILSDTANKHEYNFQIHISKVSDNNDSLYLLKDPVFEYKNNAVKIKVNAPFWLKPEGTEYQFYINGLRHYEKWSKPSKNSYIELTSVPAGDYILKVRAINILGQVSNEKILKFTILIPFWQTTNFIIAASVMFLLLIGLSYLISVRRLIRNKRKLERIVAERTVEIREKNIELKHQKESIISSITYAKRIQTAVFPSKEYAEEILPSYFIFFRPRDIVSGDFYWMKQIKNLIVIATVDCTGHGVPGAFMSMMGTSFLNDVITTRSLDNAGLILNRLRAKIKKSLHQEGKEGEQKDGMDIALYMIDTETLELQYSGAYNSLYIIPEGEIKEERIKEIENKQNIFLSHTTDEEAGKEAFTSTLIELKADRQPISIHTKETDFTNKRIQLYKGDSLYTFSDGYADQFGEKNGGKFKIKRFKNLLHTIQGKTMEVQKQILEESFDNWRGKLDQVDDVLVIGVKI